MTNQAFTEKLDFTRCQNWNTETCPNLKNPQMQLTIINHPNWFLLNDQTLEELNSLCNSCIGIQSK